MILNDIRAIIDKHESAALAEIQALWKNVPVGAPTEIGHPVTRTYTRIDGEPVNPQRLVQCIQARWPDLSISRIASFLGVSEPCVYRWRTDRWAGTSIKNVNMLQHILRDGTLT